MNKTYRFMILILRQTFASRMNEIIFYNFRITRPFLTTVSFKFFSSCSLDRQLKIYQHLSRPHSTSIIAELIKIFCHVDEFFSTTSRDTNSDLWTSIVCSRCSFNILRKNYFSNLHMIEINLQNLYFDERWSNVCWVIIYWNRWTTRSITIHLLCVLSNWCSWKNEKCLKSDVSEKNNDFVTNGKAKLTFSWMWCFDFRICQLMIYLISPPCCIVSEIYFFFYESLRYHYYTASFSLLHCSVLIITLLFINECHHASLLFSCLWAWKITKFF